jgi:thymidylate kinase
LRVALLAPDGAGKSTLASALASSFHLPSRSYYMGLYPSGSAGRGLPGLGLVARMSRQWRGYVAGTVHASRGRLVVFDRYCTDALLPAAASSRPDRLRRWLLGHACASADLTIVLDAPAQVLLERAGTHGLEELERRRQAYRSLASRLPRTVVVDAGRSPDEVRREVTAIAWRALGARASRR